MCKNEGNNPIWKGNEVMAKTAVIVGVLDTKGEDSLLSRNSSREV